MNSRQLWLLGAGVGAFLGLRSLIRWQRFFDLRGKVVLITGGSRGLGLALARAFGKEGARLALTARDAEELGRAEADLQGRNVEVFTVPCDVTRRDEVIRMVKAVTRHYGSIDVLVNNAGVIEVGPVEVMTRNDYEEALRTHFWGPLYAISAVLPEMQARRCGRIVNVTSIGGKVSMPHLVPYGASKFALVGLSEGLRAELLKDNVLVTTVVPGLMRTGSPRNADFKGQHRAEYAWFSISDSLLLSSISAARAARRIVSACKHGEAEAILSLPAKLAVLFHGVFPGWTADLLGLVNRLLPGPGGIGTERAKGRDSESDLTRSWLTAGSQQAAQEYNELGAR